MRHQRLLFCCFPDRCFSLIEAAFSLSERVLFALGAVFDDIDGDESSRGADVGAAAREGLRDDEDCEVEDESDATDGEWSAGGGRGDSPPVEVVRFDVDARGLCSAEGFGLFWTLFWILYTPSAPNEAGVENGTGCTWRRNDS
jgi:hypothetical protein